MSPNRAKQFVSFSKRRKGLFHKAAELCAKFDAQIAVIVVSSAGNAYTFGHSSVDHVLRRAATATHLPLGAADRDERLRSDRAREIEEAGDVAAWIDGEFEACETVEQLELLRSKCLALRGKIHQKLENDLPFMAESGYQKLPETQNDASFHPGYRYPAVPRSGADALFWPQNDTAFLPRYCLPEYTHLETQNDMSSMPVDWFPRVLEEEARVWNGGASERNGMSFVTESGYQKLPESQNDMGIHPEYRHPTVPRSGADTLFWPQNDTAFCPGYCHQLVLRDRNEGLLAPGYAHPEIQSSTSLMPGDWFPRLPGEENRVWNDGTSEENDMSFMDESGYQKLTEIQNDTAIHPEYRHPSAPRSRANALFWPQNDTAFLPGYCHQLVLRDSNEGSAPEYAHPETQSDMSPMPVDWFPGVPEEENRVWNGGESEENGTSFMAESGYQKLAETQNDTSIHPEYRHSTVQRSGPDTLFSPQNDSAFLSRYCHQVILTDRNEGSLAPEYAHPETQSDMSSMPVDCFPGVPEEENRVCNGGESDENGMSFGGGSGSVGSTIDDGIFDSLGPLFSDSNDYFFW